MATTAPSGSSKSTAQGPADATGTRRAAGPPPPPTRSAAPRSPALEAKLALEAEPEPKLALEAKAEQKPAAEVKPAAERKPEAEAKPALGRVDEIPPPDPSDLEPDLKTMPYVPGTGSQLHVPAPSSLPSTIPPASRTSKDRSPVSDALGRARSGFQRAYRASTVFVDSRRAKLPTGLRKAFERVPTAALIGAGLALPCFALGALVVGLSASPAAPASEKGKDEASLKVDVNAAAPPSEPAAKTPEPGHPTEARAAAPTRATASSPQASDAADEPSVLLNLADTLANNRHEEEAVAVIDRLIARRPDLRADARVAKVLMQTVYSDERSAMNATFALLEGPMGEDGAALMYQLSRSRDVRDGPRRRAESWLKSKAFERVAPLPLYALVKLKQAKTCEEKRALLGLASAGGRETLDYLRELESRTTCAPDDLSNCYPCMRGDSRLTEAITTLEKRLGT